MIAGAASGIGHATTEVFARKGARVVIPDVNVEGGTKTARVIVERGGTAVFVRADVSQASAVEALAAEAVEIYGRLDCAFDNVGIGGFS